MRIPMQIFNSVVTALSELAPTLALLDRSGAVKELDLPLAHRDNLKRLDKLGLVCKRDGSYCLKRHQLKRLLERQSRGLTSPITLEDILGT